MSMCEVRLSHGFFDRTHRLQTERDFGEYRCWLGVVEVLGKPSALAGVIPCQNEFFQPAIFHHVCGQHPSCRSFHEEHQLLPWQEFCQSLLTIQL